jgi:hypothetical protein
LAHVVHAEELHTLDGSSEVLKLNSILVANVSLHEDILVDLTFDIICAQTVDLGMMVVHVDPLLVPVDQLFHLMANVKLEELIALLLLLACWDELKHILVVAVGLSDLLIGWTHGLWQLDR